MKRLVFLIRFSALLLCMLHVTSVYAATTNSGLTTRAVSDSQISDFLNYLDIELVDTPKAQSSIVCFAVNDDGSFALGFENLEIKTVYVFDDTASFRYGYQFHAPGSFGLFFSGGNLSVYFARSGYVATFDSRAQCTDAQSVIMSDGNNAIINKLLYGTEQESENGTYLLERDFGWIERSYSRLVVSKDDGSQQILYDISRAHNVGSIAVVIGVAGFVSMLYALVRYWRLHESGKKTAF